MCIFVTGLRQSEWHTGQPLFLQQPVRIDDKLYRRYIKTEPLRKVNPANLCGVFFFPSALQKLVCLHSLHKTQNIGPQ